MKKTLETIAAREGRSVSQICELLLKRGVDAYKKEGAKYFRHSAPHHKKQTE
jgi:hypothetical protein